MVALHCPKSLLNHLLQRADVVQTRFPQNRAQDKTRIATNQQSDVRWREAVPLMRVRASERSREPAMFYARGEARAQRTRRAACVKRKRSKDAHDVKRRCTRVIFLFIMRGARRER